MAKAQAIQLPLSQLRIGITVKLPLSWQHHPFWLNRIKIEQQAQIELIKSLDVPYVFLLSGQTLLQDNPQPKADEVAPAAQPSEDEALLAAKHTAKKALRLSQSRFIDSINHCRAAFGKIASDPAGAYRDAATLVESLLEHLHQTDNPRLAIVTTGEATSVTQHGVSVAVLALIIAKAMDLSKSDMRDIALGCLFHDIGKLKVPENIRNKKADLSTAEMNFIKMHPNFGVDMLSKTGLFNKAVLNIVLHHHEYVDGSGYPDGLTDKQIPMLTQVVSLANDFDAQLWANEEHSPQQALGFLFKNHAGKHAQTLIALLVKLLGIYPPGTLVQLSDGQFAKVMLTTASVKQPHVWACSPDGSDPKLRFLDQEQIDIERVVTHAELNERLHKVLQSGVGSSFYFSHTE